MRINNCGFQKKLYLCNAKRKWFPDRVVRYRSAKPSTAVRICWEPLPRCENVGSLTEWLGSGLQNRPQQFESAGNLLKRKPFPSETAFLYPLLQIQALFIGIVLPVSYRLRFGFPSVFIRCHTGNLLENPVEIREVLETDQIGCLFHRQVVRDKQ